MFKRIVTILKQLMGYPSTPALVPAETTVSKSVKQPRAKSGPTSPAAQAPAKQKPKRKPKAAPSTTAAKSRKPKQKAAQAGSGATGKQPATRARRTRQHAK